MKIAAALFAAAVSPSPGFVAAGASGPGDSRRGPRAPKGPDEPVQACRGRETKNRIAVAELRARLRVERKEWPEKALKAAAIVSVACSPVT